MSRDRKSIDGLAVLDSIGTPASSTRAQIDVCAALLDQASCARMVGVTDRLIEESKDDEHARLYWVERNRFYRALAARLITEGSALN